MAVAKDMKLTEQDFIWIVSRTITAGSPRRMPYGLLGKINIACSAKKNFINLAAPVLIQYDRPGIIFTYIL